MDIMKNKLRRHNNLIVLSTVSSEVYMDGVNVVQIICFRAVWPWPKGVYTSKRNNRSSPAIFSANKRANKH